VWVWGGGGAVRDDDKSQSVSRHHRQPAVRETRSQHRFERPGHNYYTVTSEEDK